LIMPGNLPMDDSDVCNKSIHYLPQGWEPVIEREVDGPRSAPFDIDSHNTLFGGVQAARRTARTIFLGSAPSGSDQMIRGIKTERILLGTAQPGQNVGVFEDVIKRLRDRLHYLYSDQDRYWLDTKPNLRREMESRKQQVNDRDELLPLLRARVTQVFAKSHHFGGIHVFTSSVDVPDDYGTGPRLVVLGTDGAFSQGANNAAKASATEVLLKRGDQPRQRQNRLLFLAPDHDVLNRLKDQGRTYLAWKSIVTDIESGNLNQDLAHLTQAKRNRDNAEQSLGILVRETYKWLLAPSQEFVKDKFELRWEEVQVSPTAPNLVQEIENKLREEEWVIYEWSPIHLRNALKKWYLKDGITVVKALKVWQDMCHYLYLPRLASDEVFRRALDSGVASEDYFGHAAGKDGERYLGFTFGQAVLTALNDEALLIDREAALSYRQQCAAQQAAASDGSSRQGGQGWERGHQTEPASIGGSHRGGSSVDSRTSAEVKPAMKAFFGSIALDPLRAKMDFATIMDEVVQHFTSKLGVEVTISVDIQARCSEGFDDALQRSIKENCNVLKIRNAGFEPD
jgi:predicted AAA+ superfamily ATPase